MHFTFKDKIFACFLFSGVDKLIKAGRQDCLTAGVNDTANKFIGSVVDTAEQLVGGVVDTGEIFLCFLVISDWYQRHWGKCYRWCQRHRR